MCNRLHENSKPIKKSGKGWKVFSKQGKKLYTWFTGQVVPLNKSIVWKDKFNGWDNGDGFCFFLTKKEAKRCLDNCVHDIKDDVILPITYSVGLGKHLEDGITKGKYLIALCKEYSIITSSITNKK